MSTAITQKPGHSFVPGPALADAAALLLWLKGNPHAYVRIPVVIFLAPDAVGSVTLAFVGTDPGPPPDDAILLELDDSALGVGLSLPLGSLCAAESDACVVWIEGTWGRSLPGSRAEEPPPWPVTVRHVGPLVEDSPSTIFVVPPATKS